MTMKRVPDIIIYSDNSVCIVGEDGFGKENMILRCYHVPVNRKHDMKFEAEDGCVVLALRTVNNHLPFQKRL